MTDDSTPRLERLLEQTARKVSGGGLHPLEILQRVQEAVERSQRDGAVANDIEIGLSAADHRDYQPSFRRLCSEIEVMLDGLERRRGYSRIGDRTVGFQVRERIPDGSPAVIARFRDTSHSRGSVPGVTQRLRPLRNLQLVCSTGDRVRVTHAPFGIGRGPENDLVLASMAVSRRHAEIVRTEDGILMKDLGSRNGLVVGGNRYPEILLLDGLSVLLGDVVLYVELGE